MFVHVTQDFRRASVSSTSQCEPIKSTRRAKCLSIFVYLCRPSHDYHTVLPEMLPSQTSFVSRDNNDSPTSQAVSTPTSSWNSHSAVVELLDVVLGSLVSFQVRAWNSGAGVCWAHELHNIATCRAAGMFCCFWWYAGTIDCRERAQMRRTRAHAVGGICARV